MIMVAGGLFLDVKSPVLPLIAGTIGAVLVALILEFFLFHVDYTRTEHLQYEDDEYYYYVKAVPKMSIARRDVTIKTIQEADPGEISGQQEAERERMNRSYQNPEYQHTMRQPGPVPQETIAFTGFHQKPADMTEDAGTSVQEADEIPVEQVDFESKLEESLKEL